jgi:hypothetical protein
MANRFIITALLILLSSEAGSLRHSFYALESTDVVSKSQSIESLNKCKDQCLQMGKYFPFKFKVK